MVRYRTSGNSGRTFELLAHLVASLANLIPRIGQSFDTFGSLAGFRAWAKSQGCRHVYRSRETLWMNEIVRHFSATDEGTVVEFGVAFGEGTSWWMSRITSPAFDFYGFDRFTSLPRAWRDMPAGAFDVGGKPPNLTDPRVNWIVGEIEETVEKFDWDSLRGKKVVLFDLDLFGATLVCFKRISFFLRSGDLVFFDEAFDADERTLINEYVIPTGLFTLRAVSPLGALFERN